MRKKKEDMYMEECENQGWMVTEISEDEIELENWSPAGENLVYCFNKKNFLEVFQCIVENFDPDEHAEEWAVARYYGTIKNIPCISTLVHDAYVIDEMLWDLLYKLKRIS